MSLDSLISGLFAIPRQGIELYETRQNLSMKDSGLVMHGKKKKINIQTKSLLAKGAGLACTGGAAVLAKRGYSKGNVVTVLAAGALLVVAYDAFQFGTGMDEKDTRERRFSKVISPIESNLENDQEEFGLVCRDTLLVKYLVDPIFEERKKRDWS